MSWSHQLPEHKTTNTCYWTAWEVNTGFSQNLASLCHITKKKLLKKFRKNCDLKTSSRPFAKNNTQPLLENETFEASYLY